MSIPIDFTFIIVYDIWEREGYSLMTANEQNDICIQNIVLATYRENTPGDVYRNYSERRGICGIVTAVGGKSKYIFKDGTELEINAGQAALFSENIAYVITNNGNEPFAHYTINFSLSPNSSLGTDMVIKPTDFKEFINKCKRLTRLWHSGVSTANLRCKAVLYELIADLLEDNYIDTVGAEAYRSVLPAIHYIDENFQSEITVDFLAKLCAMSKTNFRRIFTAVCKVSPIQYLLDIRINRATSYLQQSNYSVSEIAALCGFKNTEYFCRTFKKRTGYTAGQIRCCGIAK